jgi:hypothetical protein
MPKDKEKEAQITSEELDLDKVIEEGLVTFDGELEEAATDESAISPADKSKETVTDSSVPAKKKESAKDKADESETPKESAEEKAEKKKADEADEAAAEKKKADEATAEKKVEEEKAAEKRFETHEKAEEGYKNLQGEKTRVDLENKKLKKELAAAEEAEKKKVEKAETDQKIMDFAIARHEESLKEIDELDPDDDGYQKSVSTIWAKKDRDIRNKEVELGYGATGTPAKPSEEESEEDANKGALELVGKIAEKNGIDPRDKFFLINCSLAPTEDEKGGHIDFEKQIEWAVNETKKYIDFHDKRFQEKQRDEAEKKAKENQEENLALGGSPTDIVSEKEDEEVKPTSLDDAIEGVMEETRL